MGHRAIVHASAGLASGPQTRTRLRTGSPAAPHPFHTLTRAARGLPTRTHTLLQLTTRTKSNTTGRRLRRLGTRRERRGRPDRGSVPEDEQLTAGRDIAARRQHTTAWAVQHRLQVDVRIEEQKVGGEWDRVEVGGRERVVRVGDGATGRPASTPDSSRLTCGCSVRVRAGHLQHLKKERGVHGLVVGFALENWCARRVGGRLGREPARNAGGVDLDRRPRQRGASDEHRRASSLPKFFHLCWRQRSITFTENELLDHSYS